MQPHQTLNSSGLSLGGGSARDARLLLQKTADCGGVALNAAELGAGNDAARFLLLSFNGTCIMFAHRSAPEDLEIEMGIQARALGTKRG